MPQNRGSGIRTRRIGAVVAATALTAVVSPAVAQAQDRPGSGSSLPAQTGNSSVDDVIGTIPEEIVVGGPGFGGGSEGLREVGSGAVPDAALSAGQVLGSVAPLEALGSTGGSAVASVASSGSLPGSVYANPAGSIGSGTIGLGSIAIPEYVFPILSLQLAGGFFLAMGERQEAGELYPHELTFWHDVVVGSAQGGALLEDAAAAAGTELPGGLAGSIDAVQISALEDPFEENERRRTLAEAAAEAEGETDETDETGEADESDAEGAEHAAADGGGGADAAVTDERRGTNDDDDDDEIVTSPAGPAGTEPGVRTGAGTGSPAVSAAGSPVGPAEQVPTAAPATLAATGVETTAVAGLAVVSLLFGTLLLAASRRRA